MGDIHKPQADRDLSENVHRFSTPKSVTRQEAKITSGKSSTATCTSIYHCELCALSGGSWDMSGTCHRRTAFVLRQSPHRRLVHQASGPDLASNIQGRRSRTSTVLRAAATTRRAWDLSPDWSGPSAHADGFSFLTYVSHARVCGTAKCLQLRIEDLLR